MDGWCDWMRSVFFFTWNWLRSRDECRGLGCGLQLTSLWVRLDMKLHSLESIALGASSGLGCEHVGMWIDLHVVVYDVRAVGVLEVLSVCSCEVSSAASAVGASRVHGRVQVSTSRVRVQKASQNTSWTRRLESIP